MDPFGALASFVLGKIKEGLWAQWLRFLFELGFSATVSFLISAGGLLLAGEPEAKSVGCGMIWAALAMVYLFRRERSRLTAGMIVVLPGDEAAKEMEANFQTIEKTKEEKP